jgi:hypothetical protein
MHEPVAATWRITRAFGATSVLCKDASLGNPTGCESYQQHSLAAIKLRVAELDVASGSRFFENKE